MYFLRTQCWKSISLFGGQANVDTAGNADIDYICACQNHQIGDLVLCIEQKKKKRFSSTIFQWYCTTVVCGWEWEFYLSSNSVLTPSQGSFHYLFTFIHSYTHQSAVFSIKKFIRTHLEHVCSQRCLDLLVLSLQTDTKKIEGLAPPPPHLSEWASLTWCMWQKAIQ